MYCSDNVHLTTVGYTRLVAGITDSVKLACNKQNTADIIITGEKQKYYWRGFVSTHGGKRSAHSATSYKMRTGHSRVVGDTVAVSTPTGDEVATAVLGAARTDQNPDKEDKEKKLHKWQFCSGYCAHTCFSWLPSLVRYLTF